jgi:predicted transcriptional regulator
MMADAAAPHTHVTLRLPTELIERFDKLAIAFDQPRSVVMLRALVQYVGAGGAEIVEDAASLAELDRGEGEPFETIFTELRDIITHAAAKSAD